MAEVNTPSEARAGLARVVELLDEASPGPLMVQDDNEGELRPLWAVYNADFGNDTEDGAPLQAVIHYGRKQDAEAIAAAVNFLRKHGASLLSSHGGGGEAVATVQGYRAGGSAVLNWLGKPVAIGTTLYTTPQPRAEGMVPTRGRAEMIERACIAFFATPTYPGYWPHKVGNDRVRADYQRRMGAALDAALAAAPGEGGGPKYSYGPTKDDPVVADFTGDPGYWNTPPPASQSATPSGELPELPEIMVLGVAHARADKAPPDCFIHGYTADQMRAYGQLCRDGETK